jgi:hypothetical protein
MIAAEFEAGESCVVAAGGALLSFDHDRSNVLLY